MLKISWKKLIVILFCIFAFTVMLGLLITWGLIGHREFVGFSFVCLALSLVMTMLIGMSFSFYTNLTYRKKYPQLFGKTNITQEDIAIINNDRQLSNLSRRGLYIGISILIICVSVITIVGVGAYVFKISGFISLLDNFK